MRTTKGGEILYIAVDVSGVDSTRIAICGRDKCLQLWNFDSGARKLESIFAKSFGEDKDIVPKALAFDNNIDRDLFIFGLYDGIMWVIPLLFYSILR